MHSHRPTVGAPLAALATLALALGLFACGGEGDEGLPAEPDRTQVEEFGEEAQGAERDAIAQTLRRHLAALGRRDFDRACRQLSETIREGLAEQSRQSLPVERQNRASCARELQNLFGIAIDRYLRGLREVEIESVRVAGDRAVAIFDPPGFPTRYIELSRADDAWAVADVGGRELPEPEDS